MFKIPLFILSIHSTLPHKFNVMWQASKHLAGYNPRSTH